MCHGFLWNYLRQYLFSCPFSLFLIMLCKKMTGPLFFTWQTPWTIPFIWTVPNNGVNVFVFLPGNHSIVVSHLHRKRCRSLDPSIVLWHPWILALQLLFFFFSCPFLRLNRSYRTLCWCKRYFVVFSHRTKSRRYTLSPKLHSAFHLLYCIKYCPFFFIYGR